MEKPNKSASQAETHLISNKTDKLFSVFYPNPEKETVILLHDGPGFPSDLDEVVILLQEHFQVITFHQRGTKMSPCPSKDYSMEAYISDIDSVSAFYGVTKFHLWGHSWGGLYAQIYAEKHPENLLSLFLCSPGSGTNIQWKQTEKEAMQLNRSKTTFWQWSKMGMNQLLGMTGSDSGYKRLFDQVMKNYHDGFITTETSAVELDNLKAGPINKTRPEIVKYPLLKKQVHLDFNVSIIYGDQDIYQTSKNFVLERYPMADVYIIKNSGHIPWVHNPEDYKKALKAHYFDEIVQ